MIARRNFIRGLAIGMAGLYLRLKPDAVADVSGIAGAFAHGPDSISYSYDGEEWISVGSYAEIPETNPLWMRVPLVISWYHKPNT